MAPPPRATPRSRSDPRSRRQLGRACDNDARSAGQRVPLTRRTLSRSGRDAQRGRQARRVGVHGPRHHQKHFEDRRVHQRVDRVRAVLAAKDHRGSLELTQMLRCGGRIDLARSRQLGHAARTGARSAVAVPNEHEARLVARPARYSHGLCRFRRTSSRPLPRPLAGRWALEHRRGGRLDPDVRSRRGRRRWQRARRHRAVLPYRITAARRASPAARPLPLPPRPRRQPNAMMRGRGVAGFSSTLPPTPAAARAAAVCTAVLQYGFPAGRPGRRPGAVIYCRAAWPLGRLAAGEQWSRLVGRLARGPAGMLSSRGEGTQERGAAVRLRGCQGRTIVPGGERGREWLE